MSDPLIDQPAYERFRSLFAERTRGVVIWTGAGCSASAGLPTWQQLRDRLQLEVEAKAKTLLDADAAHLRRELEIITNTTSPWRAFEALREALGGTTFDAAVRQTLRVPTGAEKSTIYGDLWNLRIRGILTLNLDRLASRAFGHSRGDAVLNELSGRDAGARLNVLKSEAPFVINLHGIIDDSTSWVLTASDLKHLLANEGYTTFIRSVLANHTVLFLGVSADDQSAGGFLAALKNLGIDSGDHFWLTERRDRDTDRWAEKAGVQVIRYDATLGHKDALTRVLTDLQRFVPVDVPAPPVVGTASGSASALPSPADLPKEAPETIRRLLSARAVQILKPGTPEATDEYEQMRAKYGRAVHNSYYFSLISPENIFFGYQLDDKIGEGAFGTVFRARDSRGEDVAVKILHQDVMQKREMLGSFRRGVRSMAILSDRKVKGMVPYREAYELPACVIMDFVRGPNLKEAIDASYLDKWSDGLRVAVDAATIIRQAHLLSERVLHRDIRPPNIMLSGYYDDAEAWSVVVLDFDISWHKGATEKSIVEFSAGTALGYMAPEQLSPHPRFSTRSTAVDSFGLGATIYFIFAGTHPSAGETQGSHWPEKVRSAFAAVPCSTWSSAPNRLARLVIRCTETDQTLRPDMGQFFNEIVRIRDAVFEPGNVSFADLWAEELLFKSLGRDYTYSWDVDRLEGSVDLRTGWTIRVRGDEVAQKVCLHSTWLHRGGFERRNVSKYMPTAVENATAALRRGGWNVTSASPELESLSISAELDLGLLPTNSDRAVNGLQQHLVKMTFD